MKRRFEELEEEDDEEEDVNEEDIVISNYPIYQYRFNKDKPWERIFTHISVVCLLPPLITNVKFRIENKRTLIIQYSWPLEFTNIVSLHEGKNEFDPEIVANRSCLERRGTNGEFRVTLQQNVNSSPQLTTLIKKQINGATYVRITVPIDESLQETVISCKKCS